MLAFVWAYDLSDACDQHLKIDADDPRGVPYAPPRAGLCHESSQQLRRVEISFVYAASSLRKRLTDYMNADKLPLPWKSALKAIVCAAIILAVVGAIGWVGGYFVQASDQYDSTGKLRILVVTCVSVVFFVMLVHWWKVMVRPPIYIDTANANHLHTALVLFIAAIWLAAAYELFTRTASRKWGNFFSIDELTVILCHAVAIGFVEELLYRVLVLDILRIFKVSPLVAVPISAAAFLWGHPIQLEATDYMLWYVIPSICAGIYYWRTGNFVALAVTHALADFSIWIICGTPTSPRSLTQLTTISPAIFGVFFLSGLLVQYCVILFFRRQQKK